MTDTTAITRSLQQLASSAGFDQLQSLAGQIQNTDALRNATQLLNSGEIVDGFETLTQSIGRVGENFADAAQSIVRLTPDIPGFADKLVQDVSSAASELSAIVGGSGVANGGLNFIISSGAPASLANALQHAIPDMPLKEIQQGMAALENAIPAAAREAIDKLEDVINEGVGFASQLNETLSNVQSQFNNLLNSTAITGLVTNDLFGALTARLNSNISDALSNVLPDNLVAAINLDRAIVNNLRNGRLGTLTANFSQLTDVISKIESGSFTNGDFLNLVTNGRTAEAIAILQSVSNAPIAQLEQQIADLSSTIQSARPRSTSTGTPAPSSQCFTIGSNDTSWTGGGSGGGSAAGARGTNEAISASNFTFVGSAEELEAEFRAATRAITEVVVHWTATYTNQDIGSEQVHEWHLQRGWSGVGYHYIIRRDGRLQRARPINRVGAHANANGHNNYSIGVSFAGGYNCPSGTANPNRFVSADSLTPIQMQTFFMFMSAFYDVWPGGQAWGHVDVDNAGKTDPGFSVRDYVRSRFGKTNISPNGRIPPLSPSQIGTAEVPAETDAVPTTTAPRAWSDADAQNVEQLRSFNNETGGGPARAQLTAGERAYAESRGYLVRSTPAGTVVTASDPSTTGTQ